MRFYVGVTDNAWFDLIPQEHAEVAWLRPEDLPRLDWADADRSVVNSFFAMPLEDSK